MRLLWLKSDYIIPPDTGGKIRTYNLLKQLNQLCDVTYLSLKNVDSPNTEKEITECASEVVTVYRPEENKSGPGFYFRVAMNVFSSLPYIVRKYRSADIREYQRDFVDGSGDAVIVCDFLEMAENVDWNTSTPKILFQHNVETLIWRRYFENESNTIKKAYFNFEQKRLQEYERATCNKFDLVFTVSEEDRALLRDDFGVTTPIEVIETGVNTTYFTPRDDIETVPGRLLFLGSMDWMPNIDGVEWFVNQVYPEIKRTRPKVTLQIVGRRPSLAMKRLSKIDPSIEVVSDVPDVRPYIAAAELFIVPLRIGGGSRIKIYEAMAMKKPVISTTVGAEGLPVTSGENILLGDRPAEFADRVNDLLANPDKRERVAANGFNLVREKYQWKSVARKFHDLCLELTEKERTSVEKK